MKSFSPAGMASKGLFGYSRELAIASNGLSGGAQSFGNPGGASRGGGAFGGGASPQGPDQGGANPPQPNQGGGGSGGSLILNITAISVGSSGPSSNGPGQTYYGAASSGIFGTPSGFVGGSFAPDPFNLHGVPLVAFGQVGTSPATIPPNGNAFIVILNQAGLPQNFFTGVSFTLGSGNSYNLLTAAAMFNTPWDDTATGGGYTTWVWTSLEGFFPPASWPNPITFTP